DTVESVFAQEYGNIEIILCENNSTDSTREILKEMSDPRIKVLNLTDVSDAAGARNAGVKEADGRYIAFLDADDLWQKGKLKKQIAFMQEKNAAFCFTGYEFADEDARPLGKIVKVPETITYSEALKNTTIFTSTVVFDMSMLTKEQIEMPHIKSEDTALWWKLLRTGVAAYGLNENLVYYRRPSKSLSSNKFEAIKRIWNLYRKQEQLSLIKSIACFLGWAFRAVGRRI
ncbi:MAG: glycosyltransferase family 2 protein, partial [Lachnospiraceae bacterium]|nr:glycosyltransferase family 2 protein [Lachnospiraceae bacterium]